MMLGKELYRALHKEAAALPDVLSCQYYRHQIQTTFRRSITPESSGMAVKRVKEAQQLLRQLQAANDGYLHSLTRVLETTYGRRGPSKHALLRPFIYPTSPVQAPSTFSPPLAALLTSSISHLSRTPTQAQLLTPPSLPPRAFPDSEEARLLGPLIPQRIKKIRLRYFNDQVGKVRAPVCVIARKSGVRLEAGTELNEIIRKAGLEGTQVEHGRLMLERLEGLSKVPTETVSRLPRRLQTSEQKSTKAIRLISLDEKDAARDGLRILSPSRSNTKWHLPKIITPRLLRRRYQSLLFDSPIFNLNLNDSASFPPSSSPPDATTVSSKSSPATPFKPEEGKFSYSVTRSKWAKGGIDRMGTLSEEDSWWLSIDKEKKGGQGKKKGEKSKILEE